MATPLLLPDMTKTKFRSWLGPYQALQGKLPEARLRTTKETHFGKEKLHSSKTVFTKVVRDDKKKVLSKN